ncbi:redoxin family protein [Phenylobacterium sp. LjRoot225]|uniref:redoxin family protein n=1 Tax=Phenylobacterium sp. LjRoot225 TaxID=3342285 RepID=UPI003ECF53CB
MGHSAIPSGRLSRGDRLPDTPLAALDGGELVVKPAWQAFGRGRFVIIGLPGAFTPVCTRVHLPGFVAKAPALIASGFDGVVCIAANDPWTLAEWSQRIDPAKTLRFLSDGNLEFGRAAGLATRAPQLFLGECLSRFLIVAKDGFVEKIAVESVVTEVSCTAAVLI